MYPFPSAITPSLSDRGPNKCLGYLGAVRCNCRQRLKQMLTLGCLLNSEVVNTKLINLGLCPDFILEWVSCALTTILNVPSPTKIKSMVRWPVTGRGGRGTVWTTLCQALVCTKLWRLKDRLLGTGETRQAWLLAYVPQRPLKCFWELKTKIISGEDRLKINFLKLHFLLPKSSKK